MTLHPALTKILSSRNLEKVRCPLWSMELCSNEFEGLKQDLKEALYRKQSSEFYIEAALVYAYWWQHIFSGGSPSKKGICSDLGFHEDFCEDLYNSAKLAIKRLKINILRGADYVLYFRTLLAQGGLPINFICKGENFGSYKRFLCSLIHELSSLNVDWDDIDFVSRLNCVQILPNSFKTDSIYAVSLQIARAIIEDREELLPYNNATSTSLKDLTESLKKEHQSIERNKTRKPFRINWLLNINEDCSANIYYQLECGKLVSTQSLPGLDIDQNYQFDIYVNQKHIGTYKRASIETDDKGNTLSADYRAMSIYTTPLLWKGESFVDVKIIDEDRNELAPTVLNCYTPSFDTPQVFDNVGNGYVLHRSRNSKNCIVVFNKEWVSTIPAQEINIAEETFFFITADDSVSLTNVNTDEVWTYTNDSQSFEVEICNYIPWVQFSNYKLLTHLPIINVFNEDGERIRTFNKYYREKGKESWISINNYTTLPLGLIELKVQPTGQNNAWINTFYSLPNTDFIVKNANERKALLSWKNYDATIKPVSSEELIFTNVRGNDWEVESKSEGTKIPSTIKFHFFKSDKNYPKTLEISVASPFVGVCVIDDKDNKVRNRTTISVSDLHSYHILKNGSKKTNVHISYELREQNNNTRIIQVDIPLKEGLTSLALYEDIINRMFNLYGFNSFDRVSAVSLSVEDKSFFIRKFTYDSTQTENDVCLYSNNTTEFEYEGQLWAYEVINDNTPQPAPITLQKSGPSTFSLPVSVTPKSYIVFSGEFDKKRMIPKLFTTYSDNQESIVKVKKEDIIGTWQQHLSDEDALSDGVYWGNTINAFETAERFRLPFTTFLQLEAVVKSPSLFAKFMTALLWQGKKDLLVSGILRLEEEFAIAIHWLKQEDFNTAISEIFKQPPFIRDNFLNSFIEFVKELLMRTIDESLANAILTSQISTPLSVPQKFKKILAPAFNEYCARAHGYDSDYRDMPTYKVRLSQKYYDIPKRMNYHYTMVNCPIRVYEDMIGLSPSIWVDTDLQLRRTINFYRKYYMRTYSEILNYLITQ
ncbi:MAG: hypothetical protein IKP81_07345 [Paludibacteraceae bacterium]|nr:hypothetical protein [Paludibacteraceae bacterium]